MLIDVLLPLLLAKNIFIIDQMVLRYATVSTIGVEKWSHSQTKKKLDSNALYCRTTVFYFHLHTTDTSRVHSSYVLCGSYSSSGFNLEKSSSCVTQAGLKLTILLPQPPSAWIMGMHYLAQYISCSSNKCLDNDKNMLLFLAGFLSPHTSQIATIDVVNKNM